MRELTRRIIRLCLITAQRVGEVCGMASSELDLDLAVWTIPVERSKNKRAHIVPLSAMAVAIIREQMVDNSALAERKGRALSHYIFPSPGARASVSGAAIATAIKRQAVNRRGETTIMGIAGFTAHDLRRTAATGMEELGFSPFVVGHVLNHISLTKASVTSRVYARYDYGREKREALAVWADRLIELLTGGSSGT